MKTDDIIRAFGKNLKQRRAELGLTQSQLAGLLGYSTKAVSKWESGNGLPSAVLLPTIARTLNTDIDSLMKQELTPLYYLGIDGGGTKTEFCLTDSSAKVIARQELGGSNPNDIGLSACCSVLKEGIAAVCGDIPLERISLFAGIAGAGTGENSQKLTKFLTSFGFAAAACGSDAQNAVAAALGNRDGIVVILGTGSVAFLQKARALKKLGGYNYLFDEGGSGFALGRDAIACALKSEERGDVDSLLYRLVLEKCAADSVLDRLGDFYVGGKRMVAQFAPLVFEAYLGGDARAQEILERNMVVIAEQITFAAQLLGSHCPETVLVGGLTKQADILIPIIKKNLLTDCNISAFGGSLVWGALRLAGLEEDHA